MQSANQCCREHICVEFFAGHYLFGNAWSKLAADRNVLRGQLCVLVLVTAAVAPLASAEGRGLIGRP